MRVSPPSLFPILFLLACACTASPADQESGSGSDETIARDSEAIVALLRERNWPETLVEDLAPLFRADRYSPYIHLELSHPGSLLPYDEKGPGPYLLEAGYLFIGFGPDGTFIAVDAVKNPGEVVYISLQEFNYDDLGNLPEITRTVAGSVIEYLEALQSGTAPLDYYDG